jgi:adenosine kinase
MKTLICGSLAFDTIMVFPDRFSRHILPDQVRMLSVSFTVGEMRREWGGCAGNIAYNLQAIGGEAAVMATLGHDGEDYRARLAAQGIDISGVRTLADAYTAQCFIITDLDDNQITAFHPGAMARSNEIPVSAVKGPQLAIIAPDSRDGMMVHAADLANAKVPYIFDPGQAITLFSGDELLQVIDGATVVAVNDYEGQLLVELTGMSLVDIATRVDALIVTRGAEGSEMFIEGRTLVIPAARAAAVVDPTGCGDAYRAGILYGMANGWDWERSGKLAATLGALKIATRGGQNHAIGREQVAALYYECFKSHPW